MRAKPPAIASPPEILNILRRPQAKADLIEIADYIAQVSFDASDRFLQATEKAFRDLARMPGIGTVREFKSDELAGMRMWPTPGFPKYLIFYFATETTLEIVRVVHGARDLGALFSSEP